jgi:hypothetical protein
VPQSLPRFVSARRTMSDGGEHWAVRVAVVASGFAALQVAVVPVYVVVLVLLELGSVFEVAIRVRPTPLPGSYAWGAVAFLVVAVVLTLLTDLVAAAVTARATGGTTAASAALERVAVERYDLGNRRRAAGRAGAALGGVVAGITLLLLLPVELPFSLLGVVLAGVGVAGVVAWWTDPAPGVPEAGLGLALVAYPPAVVRAAHRFGPADGLGDVLAGDALVVFVLAWTPLLLVAILIALDRSPDWRLGVPLVTALLLVAAGALGMQGQVQTPPAPETTVSTTETVDVSEGRSVALGGSDNIIDGRLVRVGSQSVHNPAERRQVGTLPDVKGCLFTPERHDLEVRQGVLDVEGIGEPTHYPIASKLILEPSERKTAVLRLQVDELDNATLDRVGTVPVSVADACPERSDEPRLVIYTTDGYNPRGLGYNDMTPTSHPRD